MGRQGGDRAGSQWETGCRFSWAAERELGTLGRGGRDGACPTASTNTEMNGGGGGGGGVGEEGGGRKGEGCS